jgi:hypothetical protein
LIVAKTEQGAILVGISKADLDDLLKGLTKIKEGSKQYGFSSLICFVGESDEEMIRLLSDRGTIRQDNLHSDAGRG